MTNDTLAKLAADFKVGNEYLPYHPQASHVDPSYRDGWNACYRAAQALPAAEPTRPANSQDWAGMDGQTAYWLIERHADGWADIALMMGEWLAANQAAQQAAQPEFIPVAKRKLSELQAQGYLINGYSLIHKEKLARGLIDSYGFVGWWSNRDHEQAAQAHAGWVSVEDRLPAPGKPVLAAFKNSLGNWRTARAHYAPLHTVDATCWDDGADETDEGTFEPAGWWEDPAEGERLDYIGTSVTHWMPLPQPPQPQLAQTKEDA